MKTRKDHEFNVRMNLFFALVFWGMTGWSLGRGDYWWALIDGVVFILNMGLAGYHQGKAENAKEGSDA